jgi:predicted Zn-dependent protease with MMP-like domain
MLIIEDKEFEQLASAAIDSLPDEIIKNMKNVAIVVENEPSEEQRQKFHLNAHTTLFGLYEGIPLIKRSANYSLVPPDKITIFKKPLMMSAQSIDDLKDKIKRTIWHEIAHHYGLDHDRIHELEHK